MNKRVPTERWVPTTPLTGWIAIAPEADSWLGVDERRPRISRSKLHGILEAALAVIDDDDWKPTGQPHGDDKCG